MIPATPKKLETGEWGVQVTGPAVRAGDTVLVTTRAGKTFTKTIKDVISSSGGVTIASTGDAVDTSPGQLGAEGRRPAFPVHEVPRGFTDAHRHFIQASGRRSEPGGDWGRSAAWSHACVVTSNPPASTRLSPAAETILHVAESIVTRGASPPLERGLATEVAAAASEGTPRLPTELAWESVDHSDSEHAFLAERAPDILGPALLRYLHVQVPFKSLLAEGMDAGSQRRVDFALFHPELRGAAQVIEIDGGQHTDDASQVREDVRRNKLLESAGHTVHRIPVSELDANPGPGLDAFGQAVAELPSTPVADPHAMAATQTVGALIHLIRTGILQPAAAKWMIRPAGPYVQAVSAGLRSFERLMRALEALYGGDLLPGDFAIVDADAGAPDVLLSWSDEFPWFAPPQEEGGGATHVVEVRPTWLPGATPMVLPSTAWVAPNADVDQKHLIALLQFVFPGFVEFREGQEEGIRRCLAGRDSLVLLPTGAGKSLIYQFASFLLPGLTLVVTPLVSLIEDQVDNLGRTGIDRVVTISSSTTATGRTRALQEVLQSGAYRLCYIAPERLQIQEFRDALLAVRIQMPIPLVVVDEAHCVSEWGHDFRPAYLNLGRLGRQVGRRGDHGTPAIVGLTGTASRSVLTDVQRELAIHDVEAVITPKTFDREELSFEVHAVASAQKQAALPAVLRAMPQRLGRVNQGFFAPRGEDTACGLVFCPHVRGDYGVEQVGANLARSLTMEVLTYAGRYEGARKSVTTKRFKGNEVPVMAVTKAFGMGIDKPNVRYTVHFGFPPSLEAFYQEAGRAGRDRQASHCVVLSSIDDDVRAGRLLDPGTAVEEIAEIMKQEVTRQNSDDVTRALWFHVQAFLGADAEAASVGELLDDLGALDRKETIELIYSDQAAHRRLEKALHRLLILQIVSDYTIDYSKKRITVVKQAATSTTLKRAFTEYVGAYSESRAKEALTHISAPRGEQASREHVMEYVRVLTEFIYQTVELARRTAIREVWRWSELGRDDQKLRRRLLDYLQETEFSKELLRILRDNSFDLSEWSNFLGQIRSKRDLEEIQAACARAVEDSPDHPVLRATQAIVAASTADGSDDAFVFLRAGTRFLKERYASGMDSNEFKQWVLEQLRLHGRIQLDRIVRLLVSADDGTLCRWIVESDLGPEARAATVPRLLTLLVEAVRRVNQSQPLMQE